MIGISEYIANSTLIQFLTLSSNVCLPVGYQKPYPQESIDQEGFAPNNFFNLFYALSVSNDGFDYFQTLANIILNRPYNPLYCDAILLQSLRNVLGLNFVLTPLTIPKLRRVLYSKLLANINSGQIASTIQIYSVLMDAAYVQRIRLGVSPNVSYCSVSYNSQSEIPISTGELEILWNDAVTAGIYVELRKAPADYFAFSSDPGGLGFATLSSDGLVVKTVPPYFGFFNDDAASGFATADALKTGGNMPTLVIPSKAGGSFTNIVFSI